MKKQGYSAEVGIWIDCGAHGRIALSQASSTFVIAAESRSVPPCDAQIILTVDGRRHSRPVMLVSGMSPANRQATVLSRDDVSPF